MRSRLAPASTTEYRPREANVVADYLAGQASALLRMQMQAGQSPGRIQEHQVDPPYELLLSNNASIIGNHVDGKLIVALNELPDCTFQVENCRKHRAKRSFWKHCSMKFRGSLARNDHFGSFFCENCRKHARETLVLEAFSVKSV